MESKEWNVYQYIVAVDNTFGFRKPLWTCLTVFRCFKDKRVNQENRQSEPTTKMIVTLTCTYSLKRVHWELGVPFFWEGPVRLLTPKLGVDEEEENEDDDGVLEEARVCMQDSTTLDTATSLVRPQSCCLRELLDSWKTRKRECIKTWKTSEIRFRHTFKVFKFNCTYVVTSNRFVFLLFVAVILYVDINFFLL